MQVAGGSTTVAWFLPQMLMTHAGEVTNLSGLALGRFSKQHIGDLEDDDDAR